MFKLAPYFAAISLVILVVVALTLGTIQHRTAINALIELEQDKDIALTQSFANTLWPEFSTFLAASSNLGAAELAEHPETAALHAAIRQQVAGTEVVKVKIYDTTGRTVFSTDKSQIGEDQRDNPGFVAALAGEVSAVMTWRDRFNTFDHVIEDREVVGAYVPIRRAGGSTVEGVLEIYSDVTPLVADIDRITRDMDLAVAGIFAVLYVLLVGLVYYADVILGRQYRERVKAEDDLRQRVEIERLVADVSKQLTNVLPGEIEQGIQAALALLGKAVGADYVALCRLGPGAATVGKCQTWCSGDTTNCDELTQPREVPLYAALARLARRAPLCIDNVGGAAPGSTPQIDAAGQRLLHTYGVRHLLMHPVEYDQGAGGFLALLTTQTEWVYPEQIGDLQAVFAGIFASALARQQAADDLMASRQQLAHLIASSPVILYSSRPAAPHALAFVSDTLTTTLGYAPARAVADPDFWPELIHPSDRPALVEFYARLEQARQASVEYRVRDQQGAWRCIRDEARLLSDPAGASLQIVGSWIDITAAKQAEATLRESEARFRTLVESMDDIVFTVDLAGRYTGIFGRAQETAPWAEGRMVGRYPHEVWDAAVAELHHISHQVALGGQNLVYEWTLSGPQAGDATTYQTSLSPLRNDRSAIIGLVGVSRDITTLKQLEQIKTDFVANVSHELRTPLASILGYAEVVLGGRPGPLTPVQQEFLETIQSSGKRLSALVEDLLDVSRLESEHFELDIDEVNLAALLAEAVEEFEAVAAKTGASLHLDVPATAPIVEGDLRRLRQVFDNLLSNAVKFTPAGGQVTVTVSEQPEEICCVVRDTGIGIPEEDLPLVFARFQRGRNVDASRSHGTGLGLYITKAIVEAHGGRIEVESGLQRGTTFYVWLPYFQDSPLHSQPEALVREMTRRYFGESIGEADRADPAHP